eukprot:TRINITY_DN63024_c0_g1_i1.p1 TRINITY_DN63024_c0_g1~~TRINITY_DN63024_c0_g1_i1.p1  ORF type:complete len:392 (+),score=7.75 TRINITY_DN63024_c0_g1_i1:54-1229(+)
MLPHVIFLVLLFAASAASSFSRDINPGNVLPLPTSKNGKESLTYSQNVEQQLMRRSKNELISSSAEAIENPANFTDRFLRFLRPCARCHAYKRFGSPRDGGYVMCSESSLPSAVRAAFSFGINGRDEWGMDVTRSLGGVPVFEFDCMNSDVPNCTDADCNLYFFKICLKGGGVKGKSLRWFLRRLAPVSHQPQVGGDLLLKVDVEGSEWDALRKARRSDLQRMRQIVVEFHGLNRVHYHRAFYRALQKVLGAGFVIAHIHGNNFAPMVMFDHGRYLLPNALEVTFVNRKAMLTTDIECLAHVEDLPIDARNSLWALPLPSTRLPSDVDSLSSLLSETNGSEPIQCRIWSCAILSGDFGSTTMYAFCLSFVTLLVSLVVYIASQFDRGRLKR